MIYHIVNETLPPPIVNIYVWSAGHLSRYALNSCRRISRLLRFRKNIHRKTSYKRGKAKNHYVITQKYFVRPLCPPCKKKKTKSPKD